MRTTIDIPDSLLNQALSFSGCKTKRDAVCWALEEAVRRRAVEDLLEGKMKIDFGTTPDDLEAREIKEQYGKKSRKRRR